MLDQGRLLPLMQEMSLRYFEHAWADGLEYFLWREVNGYTLPRHQPLLKPYESAQILRAAENEHCWYMYDDDGDFVRVPLSQWIAIYTAEFGEST